MRASRLVSVLVATLGSTSAASAATGGPDAFGYVWCDSDEPGVSADVPAFTVDVDLRAAGMSGDESVTSVPLPFPFPFYGVTYATAWLSSNGWLSPVDPAGASHPLTAPLPAAANPNATIATFWDDVTLEGADPLAEAGSNDDGDGYTAHVRLYRPAAEIEIWSTLRLDGCIKLNYRLTGASAVSGSTTIGIESATGTIGLAYMTAGIPGGAFRSDYAILICPGSCNDFTGCPAPSPPPLGSALRAVRAGDDLVCSWPSAPAIGFESYRLFGSAVASVPEHDRDELLTVPIALSEGTVRGAMSTDPPVHYLQLAAVSCGGRLVGPR